MKKNDVVNSCFDMQKEISERIRDAELTVRINIMNFIDYLMNNSAETIKKNEENHFEQRKELLESREKILKNIFCNSLEKKYAKSEFEELKPYVEDSYLEEALPELLKLKEEISAMTLEDRIEYVTKWLNSKPKYLVGRSYYKYNVELLTKQYIDSLLRRYKRTRKSLKINKVITSVVKQEVWEQNKVLAIKEALREPINPITVVLLPTIIGGKIVNNINVVNRPTTSIDILGYLGLVIAFIIPFYGLEAAYKIIRDKIEYPKSRQLLEKYGLYEYVHGYVEDKLKTKQQEKGKILQKKDDYYG